jgi:hypothetical protein
MTTKLPKGTWTTAEALSWGMFGDRAAIQHGGAASLPQVRSYNEARRELRDAIAQGKVQARGFRNGSSPVSLRESLHPELFQRYRHLAIDAFGETTFIHPASPEPLPGWSGIVLVESEIVALWPKAAPDVDRWMLEDSDRYPTAKRDDRIARCRKETGATTKQARLAYGNLPGDKRLSPGQKFRKPTVSK